MVGGPKKNRVADGPINGTGWYVLPDAPRELLAPGGVVLCADSQRTPHPGAVRAAASAWELLRRYQANEPTTQRTAPHSDAGT